MDSYNDNKSRRTFRIDSKVPGFFIGTIDSDEPGFETESNDPAPAPSPSPVPDPEAEYDRACCERFPGLARYGNDLPRMAVRLMAVISGVDSEAGDPIGNIDFAIDLLTDFVRRLALQTNDHFEETSVGDLGWRPEMIIRICTNFLLPFLENPWSRTDWNNRTSKAFSEKVPRQWRIRFVVRHLITLMDITTDLLASKGFVNTPDGIRACEEIEQRYKDFYQEEEPDPIKVALSKLVNCARGRRLDRELERKFDSNQVVRNRLREQTFKDFGYDMRQWRRAQHLAGPYLRQPGQEKYQPEDDEKRKRDPPESATESGGAPRENPEEEPPQKRRR